MTPFPSVARLRQALVLLLAFGITLAACSSDGGGITSYDASNPPESTSTSSTSEAPSTTVTAAETATTSTLPPTTEPSLLAEVFLAPDGSDANDGSTREQAMLTIAAARQQLAPRGVITFIEGTYEPLRLNGVNATEENPLQLRAEGEVEFRDSDYTSDPGVLIHNSSHIVLFDFRVRRALWGVLIQNSHHIEVVDFNIRDIGQEGIRIKDGSSNIRIADSRIADTGRRDDQTTPANGEGIYIGTGSPGGVDFVTDVEIVGNQIFRTTDEAIDVKRPATNILIQGNEIRDVVTQTSGAIVVHLNGDSPVDPNILIDRNIIRNVTRSSQFRDGNCIVTQATTVITNNVLHECQHRGIYLRGNAGTVTIQHNTLLDTGDSGAIVDEGRGMEVVSQNNLGASGDQNRRVDDSTFVNALEDDYRLTAAAAQELVAAPNVGVLRDLNGTRRLADGPVTFGAIEADPSAQPIDDGDAGDDP